MTNEKKQYDIPVLDFQKIGAISTADISDDIFKELGQQLLEKAQRYGLVRIKNHGLSLDFVDALNDSCGKFFTLPNDVKLKYRRNLETLQGYTNNNIESLGNKGHYDEKESFNLTHMDNLFPEEVPGIKSSTAQSFDILTAFSSKVLMVLEEGLGISKGTLLNKHEPMINGLTTLRILHYPPAPEHVSVGMIRCGGHHDLTTFSLQFQCGISGFQIKHENEWIDVDADPNIINCFFGRSFEYFTGNKFVAPEHRVVITDEKNQRTDVRKSIIFFLSPGKHEILSNLISTDDKTSIITDDLVQTFINRYYR